MPKVIGGGTAKSTVTRSALALGADEVLFGIFGRTDHKARQISGELTARGMAFLVLSADSTGASIFHP
jgi:hypothetical protein